MSNPVINRVLASAGAGKTTRIVNDIAGEVTVRDPESIVATTFTVKAAEELIERSRARLFQTGLPDQAARLLGARFGTINAICGQIVSENAIALGRSPRAEVIPEGGVARVFAVSADAAIERHAPVLNDLGDAMGFFEPKRASDIERSDWRTTVRRLIELARSNGLDAEALGRSADRSIESFLALLPAPAAAGENQLDSDLADAVAAALAAIPAEFSATARPFIRLLRQVDADIRRGELLSWPDWARLSKVVCAKKDGFALVDAMDAVCRAASHHPEHPRLREHCKQFIRTVFNCAAEALSAFQAYKSARGLLDFIDQEALALDVLRDPVMAARLGERIGRVFVDEFQDSSPLQIAIFTAIAELVDASTWVGDPKQAIYGFRNADSMLTQAAFAGVAGLSSGPQDVLATSYRSREGIIRFANAAFAPALAAMGLDPAEHAFAGTARSDAGFDQLALSVWWLDGKLEQQYAALAAAIRDAIEPKSDWQVEDRQGGLRPLEAGDVAILCRSRADIAKAAAALGRLGVRVAVEREGLARTPHVELVMAAFRWVADPSDRLALAELARFLAEDPDSDAWLAAAAANDQSAALKAAVPIAPQLDALRETILSLTPANLVDAIILLPEIMRRIETWGDVAARFDDLEALRGFARGYEDSCASAGAPATPSGLVLALGAEEPPRPRSLRDNAVKVMTYHGAKGLEWPCVILTGLNKEPRPRLFEPIAEADGAIDWRDPLANRWIRYWPWPYAGQSKDVLLDEAALASALGQKSAVRARDEEARLLYVGVTRARDYLILAPPTKGDLKWLGVLDGAQPGHVTLPRAEVNLVQVGQEAFQARVATLASDNTPIVRHIAEPFVRVWRPPSTRPPLRRRPSAADDGEIYAVVEKIELGPRLALTGNPDMTRLGEAVHAIIAADRAAKPQVVRLERAQAILDRWQVHQVAAQEVLGASDRLSAYLGSRWPDGRLYRETPVSARLGEQLVNGRVDLLVEHAGGLAVIDHKAFPGSSDSWEGRAAEHGSQLALYAEALDKARPGSACELFIHMPIVGALLRVKRAATSP
jgi:ATP-dependent helicase/nuclease subunit A